MSFDVLDPHILSEDYGPLPLRKTGKIMVTMGLEICCLIMVAIKLICTKMQQHVNLLADLNLTPARAESKDLKVIMFQP